MIHFNGKIIRTPADLQRFLGETETHKAFADGLEDMVHAWGQRPAFELLGKALLGFKDTVNYTDYLPMIAKTKKGKKK